MKYLGCAYYPEYWGVDRVETDAELMRDASINMARIGEFAWCRMEPEEGRYDLEWLHRSIEILAQYDVNVLMCTPTAAPPAWLTTSYPEVCLMRADGSRSIHGQRRHYCMTNATYREHSARITDVLSKELAKHDNVVGWQLDNELGPEMSWCHCDNCQSRFQAWLRERYESIAGLNERWATGFWSVDYTDWRQVRLGCLRDEYASRNLDSKRFWSAMTILYAAEQTEIIRRNHKGTLVTTNGMGPLHTTIDYFELFDSLDVACDDMYFDISTHDANVAAMHMYRSLKPGKRFWVTETGSGALDHNKPPRAEQFRAWTYSSLAHGGDAHLVFRWRTCLSGQEQELQGMLEHSGEPRHRYRMVKECFNEISSLRERFADLPLPDVRAAIVYDYQTQWAYEASRMGPVVEHQKIIHRLLKQLYDRNILADVIETKRDLSTYDLVILPSTVIIDAAFAERLSQRVKEGATLLALGQIGMRDNNDNYLAYAGPDHLQDLLGVRIAGGMYLTSHVGPDEALWVPTANERHVTLPVAGSIGGTPIDGAAHKWAADLDLAGGTSLMTFGDDAYAGQPAVVEHSTASGRSIYVGTVHPDDALLTAIVSDALKTAGIASGPSTEEYVEVVRRGSLVFAINHRAEPTRVELGASRAVIGELEGGAAVLPAWGVCVAEVGQG